MKKNISRQNQKNNMSRKRDDFLETMHLPKDIMLGTMKVTLTGNREAWIENYRGLLEYTDQ